MRHSPAGALDVCDSSVLPCLRCVCSGAGGLEAAAGSDADAAATAAGAVSPFLRGELDARAEELMSAAGALLQEMQQQKQQRQQVMFVAFCVLSNLRRPDVLVRALHRGASHAFPQPVLTVTPSCVARGLRACAGERPRQAGHGGTRVRRVGGAGAGGGPRGGGPCTPGRTRRHPAAAAGATCCPVLCQGRFAYVPRAAAASELPLMSAARGGGWCCGVRWTAHQLAAG